MPIIIPISCVTRVGVTRGDNWRVSPYFSWKIWPLFLVIASAKWWPFIAVVSHSHLPTSFYPVFFLNSATKKLTLGRVSPARGCHARRSPAPRGEAFPRPLVTPLTDFQYRKIWQSYCKNNMVQFFLRHSVYFVFDCTACSRGCHPDRRCRPAAYKLKNIRSHQ